MGRFLHEILGTPIKIIRPQESRLNSQSAPCEVAVAGHLPGNVDPVGQATSRYPVGSVERPDSWPPIDHHVASPETMAITAKTPIVHANAVVNASRATSTI